MNSELEFTIPMLTDLMSVIARRVAIAQLLFPIWLIPYRPQCNIRVERKFCDRNLH
ncbi:hypothetical protein [Microcoleus sp. D3_18a_C4]|uniref:hypothetical protein n=1 Tax=unclassified Microcoleus TaxID=2642155 RepID=UPI002FD24384